MTTIIAHCTNGYAVYPGQKTQKNSKRPAYGGPTRTFVCSPEVGPPYVASASLPTLEFHFIIPCRSATRCPLPRSNTCASSRLPIGKQGCAAPCHHPCGCSENFVEQREIRDLVTFNNHRCQEIFRRNWIRTEAAFPRACHGNPAAPEEQGRPSRTSICYYLASCRASPLWLTRFPPA